MATKKNTAPVQTNAPAGEEGLFIKNAELQQLGNAIEQWPHAYAKQVITFFSQVRELRVKEAAEAKAPAGE